MPGQGLATTGKSTLAPVNGTYTMPTCSTTTATAGGAANCFVRNYMNSVNATENEFVDPDGWTYGLEISTWNSSGKYAQSFDHKIYLVKKAKCDGERVVSSKNARDYAITYKLEGNGTYCADNGS